MNIDQALEKIYSLKQFHIKLGLDNIRNLLEHLDNPHQGLNCFHIAGSNGKGSTCSFLASILQEYGYKVGLYTSPHFVSFNERIRINGVAIDDNYIINFLEKNKSYIDNYKPTFFEITTALAFHYFQNEDIDYAVIETGLGGRLDATNVIDPIASVITSISYEHTHILGDSLEQIAAEKGGIIKKNRPVFIGDIPDEAQKVLSSIAQKNNSIVYSISNIYESNAESYASTSEGTKILLTETGLEGKHQLHNSALASYTLQKSLNLTDQDNIRKGLINVVKNSGLQGRYERAGLNNNIIFDAAHNLEGIEIFINLYAKEHDEYRNRSLIFGAMKDKDIAGMLKKLSPFFDDIYVTSTDYDRAATAEEISAHAVKNKISVKILDSPSTFIQKFQSSDSKDSLVILGSIYLLGDIKRSLLNQN